MFVLPAFKAVTKPVDDTEATEGLDDDHATDRPVRTFPAASLSVDVI